MASSQHVVPGTIAGFLFQPERALFRLATSTAGSLVGIEVLDDVCSIDDAGHVIWEQNKFSTGARNALTNRSHDLWNTLAIWLEAINEGTAIPQTTEFHLVTNRSLGNGFLSKLKEARGNSESIAFLALELRTIGENPAEGIAAPVANVLSYSDEQIIELLERIRVFEASDGSAGELLKAKVAQTLHLPEALDHDLIIDGLTGWIHSTTLALLSDGKPAWLTRTAFDNRLFALLNELKSKAFTERAARLLPVSGEQRDKEKSSLFVDQLRLLQMADEDDQLTEAIEDFLRYQEEATRLSQEGYVTKEQFEDFLHRLKERWTNLYRRYLRSRAPDNSNDIDIGFELLSVTLDHRERLAGRATQEYYLTRGGYHKLADSRQLDGNPEIGWHPNFGPMLMHDTVPET